MSVQRKSRIACMFGKHTCTVHVCRFGTGGCNKTETFDINPSHQCCEPKNFNLFAVHLFLNFAMLHSKTFFLNCCLLLWLFHMIFGCCYDRIARQLFLRLLTTLETSFSTSCC